jgi:MFS family permease
MQKSWSQIVGLWLIGVLAAAQLAKMSSLAPILRESYGLNLAQTGLLISLLEVGGGLFGFVAGLALGRIGSRRFLVAGLGLLTAAGMLEAMAANAPLLFTARAVEGIGYLLVVTAAPTMIAAMASDAQRGTALALWSTFVPVGVAFGSAVTGLALELASPRIIMLGWALVPAGILAALLARRVERAGARARLELPALSGWISTLSFGFYTTYICAFSMLLPTFLIERMGVPVSIAAAITGAASLAALAGSAYAARQLHRGLEDRRSVLLLIAASLIASSILALIVFEPHLALLPGAAMLSGLAAMAFMVASGIAPPLIFARLPRMAGAETADSPRIATVNGLITQFGAGGALVGPPLGGLVVTHWGWLALGVAVTLLAFGMLATSVAAELLDQPR